MIRGETCLKRFIFVIFCRGPVRFHDPGVSQQASLYPLDDDITSKLSSIQLSSSDSKVSSQPPEVSPVSVTSDLAKLVIGRSAN